MNNTLFTKNFCLSLKLNNAIVLMLAVVFFMGFTNELAATCLPAPTLSNCTYLGTFDNKFYYKYNGNDMNCPSAADVCFRYGGRLPKIVSSAHNNWLRSIVSGRFWLGLSDHHNEGFWRHQDATNPSYTKWALLSPSILSWLLGGNDFSYMDNDGYWKDCNNAFNVGTVIELPCHSAAATTQCTTMPSVPNSAYLGQFENSHYFRVTSGLYDVHQANAICLNNGGRLPHIKSSAHNQWLKNLLGSRTFWIGFSDIEAEGQWKYQNGGLANFFNWNTGEPNNSGGNEHFGEMNCSTGKWNDINGTSERTVIIEIPCTGDDCLTTSPPSMTTTTISNSCPSSTVNLNSLVPNFIPSGFSISWHTGKPASDNNKVSNPTTSSAGTYYAVFKRNADGCYAGNGEKTTKVTAKVGTCDNLVRLKNRTYDGTLNNISNSEAAKNGSVGQIYARELPADYGDGISSLAGQNRPNPRALSNKLSDEPEDQHNDRDMAGLFYIWGQFIDHDMAENLTNPNDPAPISLPSNERIFTSPISFSRTQATPGTGVNSPRQQTNFNTSWIDGSQVYGTSDDEANWLRSFENGKMKTSKGDLLPYNTLTGEKDSPIDPTAPRMDNDQGGTQKVFVAGDRRASEHSGTTSLHITFLREHNRICDALVKEGWTNDEEIYQRARKIIGALIQRVTYSQWMEAMGIVLDSYNGYNPNVSPDILNTFATAAYRWHTMVENDIILRDNECNGVGDVEIPLRNVFFNPSIVETYDIGVILKGLSVHRQYETDLKVNGGLRNFLFGTLGTDLVSINLQRGRDHGLPSYNDVREFYTGSRAHSFSDITPVDSISQAMSEIYDSVDDVDLWMGLYAEPHEPGKSIGKTVHALISSQFEKIRDGDFYFYKNDPELSSYLSIIESTNLDDIIKRNSNADNFQDNVFFRKYCSPEGDDLAKTPCNVASPFNNWTYLGRTNSSNSSNSKYYLRNEGDMTFDDANAITLTLAGHLPRINDASENETLKGLLNGSTAWLDMVRSGSGWRYTPQFNGDDVLVQGSSVSFFNWGSGEPNNAGGIENRVQMRSDGKWNDVSGSVLNLAIAEQECQDLEGSCIAGEAAPSIDVATCTNICPATTIDISHVVAYNQPLHTELTWHTSTPASNSNRIYDVTTLPEGVYYAAFYSPSSDCYNGSGQKTAKFTAVNVGCKKPVEVSLSADCDSGTANLGVYVPTGQPSNSTLTWHSAFPQTVTNRVSNITAVTPGTYYAAFKRNTDNKLFNAATVKINAPDCIENVCPATTVDLNAAFSSTNTPAGSIVTWHTGIPANNANRLTNLVVGNGNYYAAFYNTADGCYAGGGFNVMGVGVKITTCNNPNPCATLGGDTDGDGICNNDDCQPNNPNFPATPGTACNDGNANTNNDVVTADGCGCAGTPVNNNPDCDNIVITADANSIMVTALDGAPISSLQIFTSTWQQVFSCFADCGGTQDVSLPAGDYFVFAKYYTASYSPICEKQLTITVGGNDPCAALGGDSDGDGVCNNDDCQPNNPNFPATPGTSCNDGNPNTTNDVVQADGCSCAGTPNNDPCANQGGDSDGDGVCNNDDCQPNNPNFPATPGTSCNDGNPNTTNDVVQADGCSCAGTPNNDPCANQGGDSDGDGVCNNDDCQPNNPNFPATPGTSCNDGNPNTTNDVITSDGCGCQGTPTGGGDPDCTNIVLTTSPSTITITGVDAPIVLMQVFNSSWGVVYRCDANCQGTNTIPNLTAGTYFVSVKYFTATWSPICEIGEYVTVTGGGNTCDNLTGGGQIGFGNNCQGSTTLASCPGTAPAIKNCISPSGGSGTIEYIWLISTTSNNPPTTTIDNIVNDPHWQIISGATSATYSPGVVHQTSYFLRCARRENCNQYTGESNIIAVICNNGGSNITLNCPNNITTTETQAGSGALVYWTNPTASTSCNNSQVSIQQTNGLPNNSYFPVGTTTVSYLATDNCGGSADCSFTVTVAEGNTGGGTPTGYCTSSGSAPWVEWITKVEMGSISNVTGKDLYGDYTDQSTNVSKGQSYTITLTQGFSWTPYNEYWRVWIDFNRDGDFDDAGEKVLEANSTQTVQGSISIPTSAASGTTRMRIAMNRTAYADPCEQFTNGEVEDYSVNIGNTWSGDEVNNRSEEQPTLSSQLTTKDFSCYPNPAKEEVHLDLREFAHQSLQISIYNSMGQVVAHRMVTKEQASILTMNVHHLEQGMYLIQVQAENATPVIKKLIVQK